MKKSYAEKLRDPRWQKKRLKIFERDGWACQDCRSTTNTLNLHHLLNGAIRAKASLKSQTDA